MLKSSPQFNNRLDISLETLKKVFQNTLNKLINDLFLHITEATIKRGAKDTRETVKLVDR